MDSPPPTQVPLRDSLLDTPRSLQPPSSPTAASTANNSMASPTPTTPTNTTTNNNGGSRSERGELDRDNDPLMSMSNGHSALAQAHSFAQAQAHAAAAFAAAQLHNQSAAMMAAHGRHHLPNPMNQLMRKSLMTKTPGPAAYRSSPPGASPGTVPDHTACNVIVYRDRNVAAFTVDGRELICLPQAFEFFLKHLVGGLHTVYTKLKRLDIQPLVCNVEQVRILRGLGAIQPGVNRCKLISCAEFDILYEDCNNSNARPGRPPKRSSAAIHANPETLEKLKKTRMDAGDFSGYDHSRYFAEPPKAIMNGFHPSPYFPYLHMGVNGLNSMMPQPVSMAIASAQAQLAMRADPAANKDAKALMEQQEFLSRQSQERFSSQLSMFGTPSLADHSLAGRHPDIDAKPINLSNGHARHGLSHSAPGGKILTLSDNDDDNDDVMNDDRISDDDNDADLDDNSNISDGYVGGGGGDVDKPAEAGGRQDAALDSVGSATASASPSEMENILRNVIDLTQKAYSAVCSSQRQTGQDKADLEEQLMRERELRRQLEKHLEEERKRGDLLEKRLRKEKKARRQLRDEMVNCKPGSPASSGHNGRSSVPAPEMGLDLALKPSSSPGDPTRTQTTDAAESETEVDHMKPSNPHLDREINMSESAADRSSCHRDPFDVFSAAAALSSSGAMAGGSPVRFPAPYLPLIGSEVQ